jgi:hypothetical protein
LFWSSYQAQQFDTNPHHVLGAELFIETSVLQLAPEVSIYNGL